MPRLSKRSRDDDLDSEEHSAPRKLKRPTRATTVPKEGPSRATTRTGPSSAMSIRDSGSSKKTLPLEALLEEVSKMGKNPDRAEVMILELMSKYSFSLSRLKELLREINLEVRFSKVKYVDIAPRVGLDPILQGKDIPSFEMFRARLPNATFNQIVRDLQKFSLQYGPMGDHENEEARARYISGYFNETVALFSGLLFNTPETTLEGRITTKGRIEYQFKTYGGITVVFLEAKLEIGSSTERSNCFAQVIAECDACAWTNYQNGFDVPILAILCDGKQFYFFKFVDERHKNARPQLFLGKFTNGDQVETIDATELRPSVDPLASVRQVRRTCDSLYYIFLHGYQSGLEAYWNRSLERAKSGGETRGSTPGWHKATVLAREALEKAKSAWDLYYEDELAESRQSADRAQQLLAESAEEAPFNRYRYLPNYTEDMADA